MRSCPRKEIKCAHSFPRRDAAGLISLRPIGAQDVEHSGFGGGGVRGGGGMSLVEAVDSEVRGRRLGRWRLWRWALCGAGSAEATLIAGAAVQRWRRLQPRWQLQSQQFHSAYQPREHQQRTRHTGTLIGRTSKTSTSITTMIGTAGMAITTRHMSLCAAQWRAVTGAASVRLILESARMRPFPYSGIPTIRAESVCITPTSGRRPHLCGGHSLITA